MDRRSRDQAIGRADSPRPQGPTSGVSGRSGVRACRRRFLLSPAVLSVLKVQSWNIATVLSDQRAAAAPLVATGLSSSCRQASRFPSPVSGAGDLHRSPDCNRQGVFGGRIQINSAATRSSSLVPRRTPAAFALRNQLSAARGADAGRRPDLGSARCEPARPLRRSPCRRRPR